MAQGLLQTASPEVARGHGCYDELPEDKEELKEYVAKVRTKVTDRLTSTADACEAAPGGRRYTSEKGRGCLR